MGFRSYSYEDWSTYTSATHKKTTAELYTSKKGHPDMDPRVFTGVRECRDSDQHPETTPIIMAIDNTGSMGETADTLARKVIGVTLGELITRKTLSGPTMLPMCFGDVFCGNEDSTDKGDEYPLQVGQFEQATTDLAQWTEKLYLERKGYSNQFESIDLPLHFVTNRVVSDAWEKRQKKGYFFLATDDLYPKYMTPARAKEGLNVTLQENLPFATLLEAAMTRFHVYIVYTRGESGPLAQKWISAFPSNVICIQEVDKLAEVIVSTIQVMEGQETVESVAKTWAGKTSMVVAQSIHRLRPSSSGGLPGGMVVK